MPKRHRLALGTGALFVFFMVISMVTGFPPGRAIGDNFLSFFLETLKVLPCVFILIGLFDVWVKVATVEKHLGRGSGFISYLWAVLLANS
jgi:uncharacterized membrane protein YraQ (UPF0718 family)